MKCYFAETSIFILIIGEQILFVKCDTYFYNLANCINDEIWFTSI